MRPCVVPLQVKDYRDSPSQSATYRFELPAAEAAVSIRVPLSLADARWTVAGHPDLSRVLTIDFLFEPQTAIRSGQVYLSDVSLLEPGGPVDIDTSPLPVLVERLARRHWDALWSARSRSHGMIPNNSYQATDAGLNTTAAVLWMLPAATRRGWVQPADADDYVALLLQTIGGLLDRAKYLPPRNVDWITLKPSLLPEESSVDAAFLALALYQYKCLPATSPPLRTAIERTQNRFDFAAFSCPEGWRMAYRYPTPQSAAGFVRCVYDGYTNEGNLTSLAAQLVTGHRVPIETHWNTSTKRVRMQLAGLGPLAPMVHQCKEFRAPFTQALWNLFVDVRQRGVDTYPDRGLAVNPWQNFVGYEQDVMSRLAAQGRPYLIQPDAGDDGTLTCYRQFSLCEDFGQSDLFMPWSVVHGAVGRRRPFRAVAAILVAAPPIRSLRPDRFGQMGDRRGGALRGDRAERLLEYRPGHDGLFGMARRTGPPERVVRRLAGSPHRLGPGLPRHTARVGINHVDDIDTVARASCSAGIRLFPPPDSVKMT